MKTEEIKELELTTDFYKLDGTSRLLIYVPSLPFFFLILLNEDFRKGQKFLH